MSASSPKTDISSGTPEESTPDVFKDFKFSERKMKAFNFNLDSEEQEQSDSELAEPLILEPEHPLLERYQKALKKHITEHIYHQRAKFAETEANVRQKNAQREQMGIDAYECQQLVNKQLSEIDECVKELRTYTASREEVEHELELTNETYKETKNSLQESERNEILIRNEVESTNMLLNSLKKWEEDIESDLMVNQRMADKTRKEKIRLATEKKQQDIIIYKLMGEVWRLEHELEEMVMQISMKEEEREKNAIKIMQGNIDVEANEADHRCLMSGWQSIIATIAVRDKHYNNLMENYNALELKLGVLNGEIRQVKKLISKELVQNESLTMFKERIESEKRNVNRLLNIEIQKRDNFEKCIMQYESIIERVGIDIQSTKTEAASLVHNNNAMFREFEKLTFEKVKLEEAIFNCMEQQVHNNKTAAGFMKNIRVQKEKNHEMEIKLSKLSNVLARTGKECQQQELEDRISSERLKDLQNQLDIEDKELMKSMKEIVKCTHEQEKKCTLLQFLKRKLEKYVSDTSVDLSPQEAKIRYLEGQISDCKEKNKEMQMFWLREQAIVVDLSQKRQDQIRDLNILTKQTKILDQKNLKINDAVQNYNDLEDKLNRSINTLQNRLVSNQDILNKKKTSKDILDDSNNFTQMALISKLEESEFESIKLKAEIADIQEDKVVLSNDLIEKNREALCWEKRIQMAVEAKKNMKTETGEGGEIGKMKTEIHRMNVRYSHLRRAQDKLISDLENTVFRREAIYVNAGAQMKDLKGGPLQHIKFTFRQKFDDINNKMKKCSNEEAEIIQNRESKLQGITQLEEQITATQIEIKRLERHHSDNITECNNKMIDKQLYPANSEPSTDLRFKTAHHHPHWMDHCLLGRFEPKNHTINWFKCCTLYMWQNITLNLDILLFKQRKLKIYSELARGRSPFLLFKQPTSSYQKEKELNSKLRNIVENLLTDLPEHIIFLSKMHNSLTLHDLKL